LDSIDYDATVYVNAQIDYAYRYNGGPFLQHLSNYPVTTAKFIIFISGDGIIALSDTNIHNIAIEVKDASLNTSVLISHSICR